MELTRDPPRDLVLYCRQVFRLELLPACPQILASSHVADPHVDTKLPWVAPLSAAGDQVNTFVLRPRCERKIGGGDLFLGQRF